MIQANGMRHAISAGSNEVGTGKVLLLQFLGMEGIDICEPREKTGLPDIGASR
jgi:hypothetical protein